MLERFLLVWLTLLGVAAYFWARWFPGLPDPFTLSKPGLSYVFAVTMLAIGSMLPRDEISQVIRRWPMVFGGTAVQFASMPLLAYGLGRLFGLEGPLMTGMVVVGCVPGAMASNVLTLAARGNVSYSVSLTTSATLLSPFIVPWMLWLFIGQSFLSDVAKVFWMLCWTVAIPVIVGHLLSRSWPAWQVLSKRVAAIVANLTILWIIAVVVAVNRENLAKLDARLLLVLLAVNLCGYAAGWLGSFVLRLPDPMRRALTLKIGMQNAGLGSLLTLGLFQDQPATAIPAAAYTFGCMFTGTILTRLWAEFGRRG